MNVTAKNPLAWPPGWHRTPGDRRSYKRFQTNYGITMKRLQREMKLLGTKLVVVSSNLPLRADGMPRADVARYRIDDPGVAVYFTLKDRQMVMARDAFDSVYDNLHSLVIAVEHLRGLERHGGGAMLERAFAGFTALPGPAVAAAHKTWRELLGFLPDAHPTLKEANNNYRERVRRVGAHGNPDLDFGILDLNRAITEARKELAA